MDQMNIASIAYPREVTKRIESREFMAEIAAFAVPADKFALWTLGQNSFIVKSAGGTLIAIDPYLTDYCASRRTGLRNERSRILPVFIEPEDLQVDVIVLTHSHCDHADPWTLERYRHKADTTYLAPWQTLAVLAEAGVPAEKIKLMHPLQTVRVRDVEATGCFAEPTDTKELNHIGYFFRFANGRSYYNSGDTARNELLRHVGELAPEAMSICINGGYHNLSHWEAAEIAAMIRPKLAMPCHYDMMPHNVQPPHMFRQSLAKLAPEVIYRELAYYEPALLV